MTNHLSDSSNTCSAGSSDAGEQQPLLNPIRDNDNLRIIAARPSFLLGLHPQLTVCCLIALFHGVAVLGVPVALNAIQLGLLQERLCPKLLETACNNTVQLELAWLRGAQNGLSYMPVLLLYGYYTTLCPRNTLAISAVGIFLSHALVAIMCVVPGTFNLRWTWVSTILTLIGGGEPVFIASLYQVFGSFGNSRNHTSYYFWLGFFLLVGNVTASTVSEVLIRDRAWLIVGVGLGAFASIAPLAAALPASVVQPLDNVASNPAQGHAARLIYFKRLYEIVPGFVFEDWRICLVLLASTVLPGPYSVDLKLQYANHRYRWPYAETLNWITVSTFLNIPFVALCAFGGHVSPIFNLSTRDKARRVAMGSAVMYVLAFFLMGFASTPWMFPSGLITEALGTNYILACRTYLSTIVPKKDHRQMHILVNLANSLGIFIFSMILPPLFGGAIKGGAWWLGTPFFVIAIAYCVAFVLLHYTRQVHHDNNDGQSFSAY